MGDEHAKKEDYKSDVHRLQSRHDTGRSVGRLKAHTVLGAFCGEIVGTKQDTRLKSQYQGLVHQPSLLRASDERSAGVSACRGG
jgi:hypothetical protein